MVNVTELLAQRINKQEIKFIIDWAMKNKDNPELLYQLSKSADKRLSTNALWCITHLPKSESEWLQLKQNELIDRLLIEEDTAKKRLFLQLLREQRYDKNTLRSDFIDYCFSKINSEVEPYAIRCFSIYCALKMCLFYPELIKELESYLDLLSQQSLSPGLKCALRTTRKDISKLF